MLNQWSIRIHIYWENILEYTIFVYITDLNILSLIEHIQHIETEYSRYRLWASNSHEHKYTKNRLPIIRAHKLP